jgi:hypothetical protein
VALSHPVDIYSIYIYIYIYIYVYIYIYIYISLQREALSPPCPVVVWVCEFSSLVVV